MIAAQGLRFLCSVTVVGLPLSLWNRLRDRTRRRFFLEPMIVEEYSNTYHHWLLAPFTNARGSSGNQFALMGRDNALPLNGRKRNVSRKESAFENWLQGTRIARFQPQLELWCQSFNAVLDSTSEPRSTTYNNKNSFECSKVVIFEHILMITICGAWHPAGVHM